MQEIAGGAAAIEEYDRRCSPSAMPAAARTLTRCRAERNCGSPRFAPNAPSADMREPTSSTTKRYVVEAKSSCGSFVHRPQRAVPADGAPAPSRAGRHFLSGAYGHLGASPMKCGGTWPPEVRLLPARLPPHRDGPAPAPLSLAMLRLGTRIPLPRR